MLYEVMTATEKPGMIPHLDHLDQLAVHRNPGHDQTVIFQYLTVVVVEFIAVTVTFDDDILFVDGMRQAAGNKPALLPAKTHGSAKIRVRNNFV